MNTRKPAKLRLEHLRTLDLLTKNQEIAYESFKEGFNLILDGAAGTGKTYLGCYLGIHDALDNESPRDKIVIVRSALPTRDMGYLPGTKEEKEAAYTDPYIAMFYDFFDDKEAWSKLTQMGNVEFLTTSFIRGLTINDATVIIDEAQNCTFHELCSIITRLGTTCRLIICGDYYQSDLKSKGDQNGIIDFIKILNHMKYFDHIEFTWEDIVRSGMVRDFIMTKELIDKGEL